MSIVIMSQLLDPLVGKAHPSVSTAVLLAAGTGSRLKPLTDDAPKCLSEVNGITILQRLIQSLSEHGFTRLVIVVGYLGHRVRDFLNERNDELEIEFVTNPRYATTNNLYSLWLARLSIDEPCLLLESDVVFDCSSTYSLRILLIIDTFIHRVLLKVLACHLSSCALSVFVSQL